MNPCDVCAYLANENVNHDEQGRFASGPGGAQTDTPEFKEWFKGSKVVNADGKPLMVYHGTRSNFTTFNTDPKSYVLNRTLGAHFAENPDITNAFTAGQYAMASDYNVSNRPDESWYREDGDIRMDGLPVLVKREEHGQESVVEPYDYEKHGSAMWGLKEPYKKDYAVRMLKPGGQGIPVFLNIKNPLVVSPDKNTSDDTAVDKAVAKLVFPNNKDLFVKSVSQSVGFTESRASKMYDNLMSGKGASGVGHKRWKNMDDFVNDYTGLLDTQSRAAKTELEKLGYDGVKYKNTSMNEVRNGGDAWCWVAFHPTQIKSAIGNRGTWSKTDPDIANEFQESEARDEHGRWTTEGKDFTSEEGYQFHESKEMQDWVKTIPREESQAVVDYAGLSSNEVNGYLRGTLNPPPINEFVREATPEEQASFGRRWNPQYKTPIFASDPTDYDPADPNNKVADGRIVHNVFYHTDDGKKVEWSIQRVAPDTARIQRAADKAQLINDAIGKHGFVVKEPMEVGRAAYIPGMTEDDLKANVGKIFVEKGFTSTMVGNAQGRLDGYVAIGKTESIYRRYGKIKEFEDEPGVAMKMQITVPLGTKVASVESLRRSEWKFPYKNTTDEKSPDYYARDYTKGTVHLDALGDKKTRSESELLLGSGAHFRIDSVKPGGSVSTGDPTLKPVKYVNVHLTYVGGGASDPQQESANEFNPDQPRDDHGRFAPLGDMPDKDIEKTMPDYYRALSKYTDDPMSKEAHDWVKERMKASGTDVDALGHSKLGHVERVADSFHDPFHRTVGYLHDAVEDTDITLDQIKEKFGDRVAKAVEVETWKKGSGEKYDDYINRLTHNRDAIKVKLADMSDNLSHMPADVSDNPKLMEKKAAYERLVPKLELMAKPQRLTNLTPAIREKLGQLDEHYQPFNPLGSNTMARYYDHEEGWTAPRAQLHDIIVDKMRGGVPKASGQPEFTLMGGGTAAGKSTVTKSGLLTLPEHVHIDSDEIKKSLPENNVLTHGGDNRGANYVHEESSYLAKRTMRESFAAGQNVALDGTGDSKVESVEAKADEARAQGYKVRGEYVTCSVDKAIDRAAQRAAKTGRMVPVQTLRATHKSVSQIFPELVKRGTFDEAHLWDTDGDKPVLVATAKGKDLTVHEPKLWDKFLAKANE